MRQLADELRAETGEERRISGDEDDPATGIPVGETAAEPGADDQAKEEEVEDEERRISGDEDDPATGILVGETAVESGADDQAEEEEVEDEDEEDNDPGYDNSGDDDDDSPPASSHRPVTRSTPKKLVARPKRKAYRIKSEPESGSRKRTRRR